MANEKKNIKTETAEQVNAAVNVNSGELSDKDLDVVAGGVGAAVTTASVVNGATVKGNAVTLPYKVTGTSDTVAELYSSSVTKK